MKKHISHIHKALNVWGIILIIWSIYRSYFGVSLPAWVDEFIMKPLIFVLPVYYFITRVEKKNFFSGLHLTFLNVRNDILWGIGIGLVFFLSGAFGNYVKLKTLDVSLLLRGVVFQENLVLIILIALATGITEEILSRGFILKRLYEDSRNIITSSFFASILFFLLHVPILFTSDRIIGFILLRVMFTDLILSFAVSFLYLERKSLILPILIHTFYNLSIQFFI